MPGKRPQRDPIGAYRRKTSAARRVGVGAKCEQCGEIRPKALIPGSDPKICASCQREQLGRTTIDQDHVAGQANSPIAVPVWVNDHRAVLSPAQDDWPKETLENPDASPLLAAAACLRGFLDRLDYLVKALFWIPEFLEALHSLLTETLGHRWWVDTPIAKFAPKRNSRVR